MYSNEERLRVRRLYIKLGKRLGLTVRPLGHPTKNSLLSWVREHGQFRDLPAGYRRIRVRLSEQSMNNPKKVVRRLMNQE